MPSLEQPSISSFVAKTAGRHNWKSSIGPGQHPNSNSSTSHCASLGKQTIPGPCCCLKVIIEHRLLLGQTAIQLELLGQTEPPELHLCLGSISASMLLLLLSCVCGTRSTNDSAIACLQHAQL